MTTSTEPLVAVSEADKALYHDLLRIAETNRARRENGEPIVEPLQLIARHRLSSPHAGLREALTKEDAIAILEAFHGGLVDVPDQDNPRGYTTMFRPVEALQNAWQKVASPQPPQDADIDAIARSALFKIELARTEVVNPVNGSRPYAYVMFAGQRTDHHDPSEFSMGGATEDAAKHATAINDLLLTLAKAAVQAALTSQGGEHGGR